MDLLSDAGCGCRRMDAASLLLELNFWKQALPGSGFQYTRSDFGIRTAGNGWTGASIFGENTRIKKRSEAAKLSVRLCVLEWRLLHAKDKVGSQIMDLFCSPESIELSLLYF